MFQDFQGHMLGRKIFETEISEDKERTRVLTSQFDSTIDTITLIFSQSQSTTLHSDVEFVNLLIKFITIVSLLIAVDLYFRYHLLKINGLTGKLWFEMILSVIRIVRNFYTYLLATLIRDKISPNISDKEFGEINVAPLLIVLVLYLVIIRIITFLITQPIKLSNFAKKNKTEIRTSK